MSRIELADEFFATRGTLDFRRGFRLTDEVGRDRVIIVLGTHTHLNNDQGGLLDASAITFGSFTGSVHDGYIEIIEAATPANPAVDRGRVFARANGSNIELVFISSQGIECVLCTLPDNTVTAELQLNWVE